MFSSGSGSVLPGVSCGTKPELTVLDWSPPAVLKADPGRKKTGVSLDLSEKKRC